MSCWQLPKTSQWCGKSGWGCLIPLKLFTIFTVFTVKINHQSSYPAKCPAFSLRNAVSMSCRQIFFCIARSFLNAFFWFFFEIVVGPIGSPSYINLDVNSYALSLPWQITCTRGLWNAEFQRRNRGKSLQRPPSVARRFLRHRSFLPFSVVPPCLQKASIPQGRRKHPHQMLVLMNLKKFSRLRRLNTSRHSTHRKNINKMLLLGRNGSSVTSIRSRANKPQVTSHQTQDSRQMPTQPTPLSTRTSEMRSTAYQTASPQRLLHCISHFGASIREGRLVLVLASGQDSSIFGNNRASMAVYFISWSN